MSLDKPLDEITEDDLKALEIPEGKTIDYKSSLYGNSNDDKKEFLADVSSFANAAGGHIILGVMEENGVPIEVGGLADIDPDAEILRMESMLRDNIEPRIPGVSMRAIPLENTNIVIIIRIPRSWSQPHVVNRGSYWRFFSRNSAGKYPLDVHELRAAFALSETTTERIRIFRTERLGKIIAGEAPIAVGDNTKIVLHIIPFGAFDPSANFDPSSLEQEVRWSLWPINGRPHKQRYNLDGLLSYSVAAPYLHSYVQLFRNGIIESVETSMLMRASMATESEKDSLPFIPSVAFEAEILRVLPMYLRVQKILGVTPPLFIILSLIGVSGFVMATGRKLDPFGEYMHPIDRDTLILPEVIIENFETGVDAPATVMRPIFDSVWNATGWPRSMSYNDEGEWGKGPNSQR